VEFVIEPPFWALFPEARIGVVVVRGVDNAAAQREAAALLARSSVRAAERVAGADIPALPAVAPWRAAYAAFGAKPSKFRSSIESLLRGALAGRLGSINPLVDLYNSVSLARLLPCGGEDLAAIRGDLRLTRATGDEPFVPLGGQSSEPPRPGEVIYRDDAGAICRCWNWREADRTRLTPATTDAFLCIEALPPVTAGQLRAACDELAALVSAHLGGDARVALLDQASPPLPIDPI
jgi:DNA/RNA-binding domain of Phe-tRNA-synthetase-like protein